MSDEEYQSYFEEWGYKCPYCKTFNQMYEVTDVEQNYTKEIIDCEDCSSKFYITAHQSLSFESTPDCELNGGKHKWSLYNRTKKHTFYFCDVCGVVKMLEEKGV